MPADSATAAPPTPDAPAPPAPDARLRTRVMAGVGAVLAVAVLRVTEPVTLPFAVALFLIVLARPLQRAVERHAPRWVAVVACTLALLIVVAVIASGFALSLGQLAGRAPELAERLETVTEQARRWAERRGIPVPADQDGSLVERLFPLLSGMMRKGGVTLERLGLVVAFFVLGLLEVDAFRDKARTRLAASTGEAIVGTAEDIAHRVRRYIGALSITSLISGVATGLFALAVGLDSPLTWGLVAFLLNYVPTVGPFVSVVPPTLYALLQFGGVGRAALVFFGVGAIQFFIGNFLDPKIEGRALSMSALVVLLAVIFWGWVWGVLGALLGVPITAALLAVCERFERARWLPALLADEK